MVDWRTCEYSVPKAHAVRLASLADAKGFGEYGKANRCGIVRLVAAGEESDELLGGHSELRLASSVERRHQLIGSGLDYFHVEALQVDDRHESTVCELWHKTRSL